MKLRGYKKLTAAAVAAAMSLSMGCSAKKTTNDIYANNSETKENEKKADTPVRDPAKAAAGSKPNIVLIVTDDLGYGDTSLFGHPMVTPNIQSIADNGVLMTQGYVTAPVCAPSRMSLLTSLYSVKMGGDSNYSARNSMERVPNTTIASLLKDKGYSTMAIGKWDVGTTSETTPVNRGFEGFYGILNGVSSYYQKGLNKVPADGWHLDKKSNAIKGGTVQSKFGQTVQEYNPSTKSYPVVSEKEYLTDAFTREALEYIDKEAEDPDPFFLYLSYNAPHLPLQAPDDHVKKFQHISSDKTRLYYAMVDSLDEQVGRVLQKLEEKGLSKNTMVVFISDNGPEAGSSGGLRGGKYGLFEGGIHIPFAIKWPEQYDKNTKFNKLAASIDILPTVAAAAGYDAKELKDKYKIDGVDITPYIQGKQTGNTHDDFFWRVVTKKMELQLAVRSGDFKYMTETSQAGKKTEYLFNIAADPKEQSNLISKPENKEVLDTLKAKLEKWHSDNPMNTNLGDGTDEEDEE